MFRDDKEAMVHRVDSLSREADVLRTENTKMREELIAIQRGTATSQPGYNIYAVDPNQLDAGTRAALAEHHLTPFPVWAVAILNLLTFGLFPMIHFGLQHDKLPAAHPNDPSAGKAIGFTFIPYFNLYWVFFNSMRLADRLNLQYKLRGRDPEAPKGLMVACSVFGVIPYINFLIGWPIMWTIGVCFLQSSINKLCALGPLVPNGLPPSLGDPSTPHGELSADPYAAPPVGLIGP